MKCSGPCRRALGGKVSAPYLWAREDPGLGVERADPGEGGCGKTLAALVPADWVVSLRAAVASLVGFEVPDQDWCGRLGWRAPGPGSALRPPPGLVAPW